MSGGSPRPKWAARMNSAVRKSSTILSFARSTPSRASSIHGSTHERESSDSASINKQKIDTAQAVVRTPELAETVPSPIIESPIREAAADKSGDQVGPSPLVHQVLSTSPEPLDAPSPIGYTPPPVIESDIGNPGAFVDHIDEELPQPVTVTDPYTAPRLESTHSVSSAREQSIHAPSARAEPTSNESAEIAEEPNYATEHSDGVAGRPVESGAAASLQPGQSVIPGEDSKSVHSIPSLKHTPESSQINKSLDEPPRLPTPSLNQSQNGDRETSYFDPAVAKTLPPAEESPDFAVAVQESPLGNTRSGKSTELDFIPSDTIYEQPLNTMPVPVHDTTFIPSNGSAMHIMPLYGVNSETEVWGDIQPNKGNVGGIPNNGDISNIRRRASTSDPFSDPIAPRITVTHSDKSSLPTPTIPEPHLTSTEDDHREVYTTILTQPLLRKAAVRPLQHEASVDTFEHTASVEIDETRPLLSHSATPKGASYLQPNTAHNTHVDVSPLTSGPSRWNPRCISATLKLHELGWIEYHLPDSTFYYVHPTRRVITDVNLRVEKALNVITAYLEGMKEDVTPGCELWLRDAGSSRKGFVPVRSWVNHNTRSVIAEAYERSKRNKKTVEEDQLDTEFRYWSFMEGHPAHTNLPLNAKTEALEALSWAWTDRLLPSDGVVPAPFTQEECQELNNLLRSFTTNDGIQTRLVARILLRVARWRQTIFRPNKPLPKDVAAHVSPLIGRRRSFIGALRDFLLSVICLGIPYIFFERQQQYRIDEESGLRNAGPMLVIGACTCLVAAIVLSASVTFLSLPGLDNVGRIAGFIATLFSSFSLASTLVAIFKYKADLVRTVPSIGEGLTWVSKRSVIFSLPLVFLAYAIIGFITGITLYALRGGTLTNPNNLQTHSDPYTRWTTFGAIGAFAGVLSMSFLLRR